MFATLASGYTRLPRDGETDHLGIAQATVAHYEAGRMHGSGSEPQGIGHLVLAVDPGALADFDQGLERAARMIERLHELAPAEGFDRVDYPGERGERVRRTRERSGIPVTEEELDAIAAACDELGWPDLAAQASALATGEVQQRK